MNLFFTAPKHILKSAGVNSDLVGRFGTPAERGDIWKM